jgi:hypothetical protein
MCTDKGCDRRSICKRYRARPNFNQMKFDVSPRETDWLSCKYLMLIRYGDEPDMRSMSEIEGETVTA